MFEINPPDPNWIFLPQAPITIASKDANTRSTFFRLMKRRLVNAKLKFVFCKHTKILKHFILDGFKSVVRLSEFSFNVTRDDEFVWSCYFWEINRHGFDERMEQHSYDLRLFDAVRYIWETALDITNEELAKRNWHIVARVDKPTAPFTVIPPDVWCNYEVSDWARGTAKATSGDTLYSVHLAPTKNHENTSDEASLPRASSECKSGISYSCSNTFLYSLRTATPIFDTERYSAQPLLDEPIEVSYPDAVSVGRAKHEANDRDRQPKKAGGAKLANARAAIISIYGGIPSVAEVSNETLWNEVQIHLQKEAERTGRPYQKPSKDTVLRAAERRSS